MIQYTSTCYSDQVLCNTRCCNPVLSEGFSIARVHQQGELHVLLLNKEIKKDENVARIDRMGRS